MFIYTIILAEDGSKENYEEEFNFEEEFNEQIKISESQERIDDHFEKQ